MTTLYTHAQADQLVGRLLIALSEKLIPPPQPHEVHSLKEALVSVRMYGANEDWRAVIPNNPAGVGIIFLTVGHIRLIDRSGTRLHPLNDWLEQKLMETPLTTEYDDVDRGEYLHGILSAMAIFTSSAMNETEGQYLSSVRIQEIKRTMMPSWAKYNKARHDGMVAICNHLEAILTRHRQSWPHLKGTIFHQLMQLALIEAFAAEKPAEFDMNLLLPKLNLA